MGFRKKKIQDKPTTSDNKKLLEDILSEDNVSENNFEVKSNKKLIRREVIDINDNNLKGISIADKLRIAKRYRDAKTGKTEREKYEKLREENEKEALFYNTLKTYLMDTLAKELDEKPEVGMLEIQIDHKFDFVIHKVLNCVELSSYIITEIPRNVNQMKMLKLPRVILFKQKSIS